MKPWVQMTLVLFPLISWSLMPGVSGFAPEQLQRITNYIHNTYKISGQHAYTIKFNENECKRVSYQDIKSALIDDKASIVGDSVLNGDIYEGSRLIMASFKELGDHKREHAEHRLLYPAPGSYVSPVQNLLNKAPPAGCAIFFTLKSPCQKYCSKPNGQYNIVSQLVQFNGINNRAFVYHRIYNEPNVNDYESLLRSIHDKMPLYRCDRGCIRCFPNGVFDNKCLV